MPIIARRPDINSQAAAVTGTAVVAINAIRAPVDDMAAKSRPLIVSGDVQASTPSPLAVFMNGTGSRPGTLMQRKPGEKIRLTAVQQKESSSSLPAAK